ncbi:MAG TPA: hypothetical protein VK808_14120 [Bacteroidia bacterium]|jgi:hypothetical protein|nr:hypothetical protein [Bacteroidia bacterium]
MKKLFLTFGIFLAGMLFVNAQDKVTTGATKLINKLTEVCSLTPDQAAKLQPVAESFVKAHKDNKQKYANDPAGLKTANKSVNSTYKSQLQAVLTPDQMKKFAVYNAQKKGNKQGGGQSTGEQE